MNALAARAAIRAPYAADMPIPPAVQEELGRIMARTVPKHLRPSRERAPAASAETRAKAIQMIEAGKSVKAAAKAVGAAEFTVRTWLRPAPPPKPKGKGMCKPVTLGGRNWPSISAATRDIGISETAVSKHLRTPKGRAYLETLLPPRIRIDCDDCPVSVEMDQ